MYSSSKDILRPAISTGKNVSPGLSNCKCPACQQKSGAHLRPALAVLM